ncbi:MAG: hypothetical protein ACKOTH_02955, partial [Solirubrobacterales bacterium]
LRLVLSELQKAEKEGDSDEVGVLRRERKRRHEAVSPDPPQPAAAIATTRMAGRAIRRMARV